jgi:hypothetical protein
VTLLGELFERQVNAGDATRASLTYKKLARHSSPTWEQKFRFGQLLEGSNKKLAVGTYESALSDLAKLENKKGALQKCWRAWWNWSRCRQIFCGWRNCRPKWGTARGRRSRSRGWRSLRPMRRRSGAVV